MDVTIAIVAPPKKIYESLYERTKSLAKEAGIENVVCVNTRTIQEIENLLVDLRKQQAPLCMCCDIMDGPDAADEMQQYLEAVWRSQGDIWLRQKPLIIISESDDIIKKMKLLADRDKREHSFVYPKLPVTGANRWKNIRDALKEGIIHA